MQNWLTRPLGALGLLLVAVGCEPSSVTEAREQLQGGQQDTLILTLPVAGDTVFFSSFIDDVDTLTTSGGLLAVRASEDTVSVTVGEQLQFASVNFDQFTFSYDQMLRTDSAAVPFPALTGRDTLNFVTEFAGSNVTSATLGTGSVLIRTIVNATSCTVNHALTVLDGGGNTVVTFPATAVAAMTTAVDTVNGAGATFTTLMDVEVNANTGVCVPGIGETATTEIAAPPLTLSSVTLANVNETFNQTYDALLSETRIQAVDTIGVFSGTLTLTLRNRLPIGSSVDVTLNGVLDAGGAPLTRTVAIPAAAGDGSLSSAAAVFDLAGTTIVPADAQARAEGTATAASATVTSLVTTDAAIVDGTLDLEVDRLVGTLDPATTPELAVSVEDSVRLDPGQITFDELEDVIQDITLNGATVTLAIDNDAGIPLQLDNVTLGAVRLQPDGSLSRDGGGNLIYETDGAGAPLLVTVAPVGDTVLTVPANTDSTLTLDAAALMDRVVKLVLQDVELALVTAGRAVAGDGTLGSIRRTDNVSVAFNVTVPMDFTLPLAGVEFGQTQVIDALDLDPADADELTARIISADATAQVENFASFGAEVAVAIAPDSLDDVDQVFAHVDAVQLDTLRVAAPAVDANGIPQGTVIDSVTTGLTGAESRVLFSDRLTGGFRVRLLPGTGGGGRGALRPTDGVVVRATAVIRIRRGTP